MCQWRDMRFTLIMEFTGCSLRHYNNLSTPHKLGFAVRHIFTHLLPGLRPPITGTRPNVFMLSCLMALAVVSRSGKLLLVLTSTAILSCRSHRTYHHIFLSCWFTLYSFNMVWSLCVYLFRWKHVLVSSCIAMDASMSLVWHQYRDFLPSCHNI
jgi:hypothetical protein